VPVKIDTRRYVWYWGIRSYYLLNSWPRRDNRLL